MGSVSGTVGSRFFRLEPEGNFVRILPLGDLHCGNRAALLAEFHEYVEYIRVTPDVWVIIMGDMMENVLPSTAQKYPGAMFDQYMSPEEQKIWVRDEIAPIAPRY